MIGATVFFLSKYIIDVIKLSTVFNTIIWMSIEPEILSAPKRTGIWRKKNKRAAVRRGRITFLFDSSERRLKTNPVDNICSRVAAMIVDRIQMIDTAEMWKEGNGSPRIIRAKNAIPTNNPPTQIPNNISNAMFFFDIPIPFKKDVFSVWVTNQ